MLEQNRNEHLTEAVNIAGYTADFVGRMWVFQAINSWLADEYKTGIFLLTGEQGAERRSVHLLEVSMKQEKENLTATST